MLNSISHKQNPEYTLHDMRKELDCIDLLLDRDIDFYSNKLKEISNKFKKDFTDTTLNSIDLLKRVSKKITSLSNRIDLLRGEISTEFKAEPTRKPKNIAQEILEHVKNFFQKIPNGFIFTRYSQKFIDKRLTDKKQDFISQRDIILLEHQSLSNKVQQTRISSPHHLEKLKDKLYSLRKKLVFIEEKLEQIKTIESYGTKGDELRKHASVIGAERISLLTEDNIKLDSLYFDAKAFRKSLKDAGGKLLTFRANEGTSFQGISIPFDQWEIAGRRLIESLESLHGLSYSSVFVNKSNEINSTGAGWTAVKNQDNILLVRSDELPSPNVSKENNSTPFEFNKFLNMWVLKNENNKELNFTETSIDDESPASGTVILTSGNFGIYEVIKDEPLAFLFRNMNVVQFNFRGYGNSKGIPTEEGLKLDMEAAYQFARSRGQPPTKILFKALCMSGGPAAYCAVQHPGTNIFIDQSYESLKRLVKEEIEAAVAKKAKELIGNPEKESIIGKVIDYILNGFTRFMIDLLPVSFPDYNTGELLAQHNGKKAILYTREDEDISIQHVTKTLEKITKAGKLNDISLYTAPGGHGASLLEIEASRFDFLKKESRQSARDLFQKEEYLKCTLQNLSDAYQENINKYKKKSKKLKKEIAVLEIKMNAPDLKNTEKEEIALRLQDKNSYLSTNNLLFSNLINKFQEEQELFQSKLNSVQIQLNELIPLDMSSIDMAKNEFVAMNQLDQFLRKCNLSKDILCHSSKIAR